MPFEPFGGADVAGRVSLTSLSRNVSKQSVSLRRAAFEEQAEAQRAPAPNLLLTRVLPLTYMSRAEQQALCWKQVKVISPNRGEHAWDEGASVHFLSPAMAPYQMYRRKM